MLRLYIKPVYSLVGRVLGRNELLHVKETQQCHEEIKAKVSLEAGHRVASAR